MGYLNMQKCTDIGIIQSEVFVIISLRIFVQIHIFMNATKGMKRKQRFVSLSLIRSFHTFLHLEIPHECIKIHGLVTIWIFG